MSFREARGSSVLLFVPNGVTAEHPKDGTDAHASLLGLLGQISTHPHTEQCQTAQLLSSKRQQSRMGWQGCAP